jgi:serine/threonine protein kinase
MSSDPRENRKDAHKTVPKSGTSRPADSTTPDEEQFRSLRAQLSALFSGHVVEIEEIDRRLKDFPEDLRQIVSWKLEGFTNAKIASLLGRTERAVELKLQLIRRRLAQEPNPSTRSHDRLIGSAGPVTPPVEELSTSSGELESLPPPSFETGQIVFGKYRLLEKIGEGGMGSVWRVWHTDLECERALKLIKPELAQNDKGWRRFQREARLMAKIDHLNAVAVYDFRRSQSVGYIEMEYVPGRSLTEILRQHPDQPKPLDWIVPVINQLCSVLQAAHDHRDERTGKPKPIIHRDLKPSNLMLVQPEHDAEPPKLKVLDFGIANLVEDEGGEERTATGVLIGTPAYMSPEQIKGGIDRDGERHDIDGRSDIYSTGVLLYQLLTGVLPFRGSTTAMLAAHLNHSPPPMNRANPAVSVHISPEIERLVTQSLEKDPARRPQSASDLADRFHKAIGKMKIETVDERPLREEAAKRTGSASPAQGASDSKGLFMRLFACLGRSLREAVSRSGSAARPGLDESKSREREGPLQVREVPATIRRRADISFPSHVLVGKPYHLSIQLVPIKGDAPGGLPSVRRLPYAGDWPLDFLALSFSSFAGTRAPLPIKVIVSLVAENFEVSGTDRAELIAPFEGPSNTVQFRLRGVEVGPGRVMIDFAQGGRPIGSVDLAPEVVATIDPESPPSAPAPSGGTLILNLAAGQAPAPPDLVIKVFEHRLAGHAGRLQFVLSSTLHTLSDLPVLDGDLGTLDLRAELVVWVGEQLREVGAVAERPDVTAEEAERTLARIGCNLFQQLLPPPLQDLCWTFRERGVRAVMVLSDEPHIPWELIKPYRDNPRTGEFEEDEFWGHSYALTHWLRGRPPVRRLSLNRICAMAAKIDGPPVDQPNFVRDMVPLVPTSASVAEISHQGSAAIGLKLIDDELEVLRSLEASGSQVRFLPARRREILGLFEQGKFDLLHLITHGDFGGLSAADASAVQMEDGAFLVAELSPRMAAALRRAAPLIFFNSCHTGRIGFSLTQLGSWGAQFVHSGCGGFVGTLWPVTDRAALAFAQAFYGRMCQGLPIGQTMMAARQQVRERYPNDPTWLAYCCFADPMAQVEPSLASR